MKKLSYQYLAGLIDGEGCVTLKWMPSSRAFAVWLDVSNTQREVLDLAAAQCGGGVYKKGKVIGNRKPCYRWVITGKHAVAVLKAVHRYSIIKKPQIEAILEYWKSFIPQKWGQMKLSTEEFDKRMKHVHTLRQLNQRGASPIDALH